MDVTSFFDGKQSIVANSQGTIAKGTAHADVVFPLGQYQRHILVLTGVGPDPVGTVSITIKSKKGAAAAVPLPLNTLLWAASGPNNGGPLTLHTNPKTDAAGKITIPAAVTTGDPTSHAFTYAVLVDVPAILPDGADQLAVAVANDGSADSAFNLTWIGEHPRF